MFSEIFFRRMILLSLHVYNWMPNLSHLFVLLFIQPIASSNPCQRLCEMDGPIICTNGSYERNGGICHAYFRLGDNGHCYHTVATQRSCPSSLPPLTVREAEVIVSGSGTARSVIQTTSRPTTTVTTPTLMPLRESEFSSPEVAARFIGALVEDESRESLPVILGIAYVFSRREVLAWSSNIGQADAIAFWNRANGPALLARAATVSASQPPMALIYLLSFMPFPNQDGPFSREVFLEQIGATRFIQQYTPVFREHLQSRVSSHGSDPFRLCVGNDRAANVLLVHPARNWLARFPDIVNTLELKSIALRQRIRSDRVLFSDSGYLDFVIRRNSPLISSAQQFARYSNEYLRTGSLSVIYEDDLVFGTGVNREYFALVASAVMGPGPEALFETSHLSGYAQIIPGVSNMGLYTTLGKFFALSLSHGFAIGIPLPPVFFRKLLGETLSIDDIREVDEEWARSALMYMSAESDEEILSLSLGEHEPLPWSGSLEPITMTNRAAQVQRAIDNIVSNNLPMQFDAIAEGFFTVLPRPIFAGLQGEDLHAMIVGNLDYSVAELIDNMHVTIDAERTDWLHQILREFTPYLRRGFLRFVTGVSVVPAGGWLELGLISVGATDRISDGRIAFPQAETWARELTLPNYESLEEMREILTNVCADAMEGRTLDR